MSAVGITIVGASAGSGKTYRLTQEVTAAVAPSARERVDLSGLVAVTFTRKAHAELEARIRKKLVEEHAYEEALRLPLAYVGTVHATALRLLQEFAVDAGLSPSVDVVAGNETKLLRQAFERTLDDELRGRLDDLAARLELRIHGHTKQTDWVTPVADIMDLARSNRILPDALPAMASRSVKGLLALLPRPSSDGDALDLALGREIDAALRALERINDGRKNTEAAIALLESARTRLADGELRWSDWQKLATVAPSKACAPAVEQLRAVAARYEEHPRLHEELSAMTHAIFDAARAGLVAYQEWKMERRVVDYVDMLDGALDLLEQPRVRAELSRRLGFVVVDEFQDTSPIQLALFVRLHDLAKRSVWVGDRKQCIFEYAGADPVLMDAVADWVSREGGARDKLGENHRSRPELVYACSELFAAALARHGFSREEVVVRARRPALADLAKLPPLGVWALQTQNKDQDAQAIAEGVCRLLDAPEETPVVDRATSRVRPLRPGDVAILVATNEWASLLADALHARGVRAALARAGLFDTPEGTLVSAALRWLVDDGDRLSAAVVDALTGWDGQDPDTWLTSRLREMSRDDVRGDEARGWRAALAALRPNLSVLSPSEALDATIAALDVVHLGARWPDPVQRIANLDALRATAAAYEARCAQEREASTVAGMLRYFDALRSPTLQRDEMLPSDDQHVPSDEGAVTVCTYHKSKGLEWPVVVLANLDREERRDAFDVAPESLGAEFDPERPLANRVIRYWPWPLGATKNAPLADAAEASPEGRAVAQREEKERARLLYVGFTRARDHLVLAARVTKGKARTAWLDTLSLDGDEPIVELPANAADGTLAETVLHLAADDHRVPTRVFQLGPVRREKQSTESSPRWFARPDADLLADAPRRPPYRITPSAGEADWPELADLVACSRVGRIERLPSGIALDATSYDDDVLGNAVHGFLAADVEELPFEARLARARDLVNGWSLSGIVRPDSLVAASDRLRAWIRARWPDAIWHREMPIEAVVASEHGERRLSGILDLLLETETSYVVIDHKTFPATSEPAWRAKCKTFIPQLAAYVHAVAMLQTKPVEACWVHLPVGGAMAEIVLGSAPIARV